ncbi:MAG: LysR family transcriptional regulator [Polyangiales bacterium]
MDRFEALRLFVRLAERESFTGAARDLGVKQSTASKWVAALEEEHGVGLVERTTRALRFTEAGQLFLGHARDVLAAYEELEASVARDDRPQGRLRMSLPVVFGRRHVVPALVPFLRANAGVEVQLVLSDRYVSLVDEGFDLAVRVGEPVDTSDRSRKLADGGRVLVASKEYLVANGRPRHPRELRGHRCLSHVDTTTRTVWRFRKEGEAEVAVPVGGGVGANHSDAVLELARAGLGVALLADWLVDEDLREKRLVPLLRGWSSPPASVHAIWPASKRPRGVVRAVVEHLGSALPRQMGRAK